MNATILNREFQHPTDGWYQIEPKGRHPNRAAGVVQVIDEEAAASIVNRFNAAAEAGELRHGHELLIDHEHFSESADQETVAYGWLTKLQNRADGIYGQIRWTGTGQKAVDGGDYRFFSTVYEPEDCVPVRNAERGVRNLEVRSAECGVRNKGTPRVIRPLRLDGLSLTNMNNNRGQKPITNRGEQFRHGLEAGAGSEQQRNKETTKTMKTVATKLGLSADASEEAVLAEVTKIVNRATTAEGLVTPLQTRVGALETENATLLSEQLDADFATAGIKDEKSINRHKPLLSDPKHFTNREQRVEFIKDLVPAPQGKAQTKLQNRDTKPPTAGKTEEGHGQGDQVAATKIMNRATELVSQKRAGSLATAVKMAQNEMENGS